MIGWALETLAASTVLMLAVLALREPVRRAFGANVAYALWAIPAVRMILPPLPDSWHEGAAAPLAQAGDTIAYYIVEPLGMPTRAADAAGSGIGPWLLVAWIAGAAAFIGYHAIAHGRFCTRVRRLASSTRIVAAGNVAVIETDAAAGPLAFGILRKYVAFPRDFADRYDPLERDLALAHELGHHARGDLIANWAALVVLALHWFNPVAWRAFRAFRADQEMACDALVLAGRARELRAAYGRAIVKSAHGGAVSAACHLHTINDVKGRLRMLSTHETTSTRRMFAGMGATTVLLIGGLGLTASGTKAAASVRSSVESAVGVDLAAITLPTLAQSEPLPPPPALPKPRETPVAGKSVRVTILDKDGTVTEFAEGVDKPGQPDERRRLVFRGKDGKPITWNGSDMPLPPEFAEKMRKLGVDLATIGEIRSQECSNNAAKTGDNGVARKDGDKRVVILCTNRITRQMTVPEADMSRMENAFVFQRRTNVSALEGLRDARRRIEEQRDMSDDRRATALSGIDQAIRELESKKD